MTKKANFLWLSTLSLLLILLILAGGCKREVPKQWPDDINIMLTELQGNRTKLEPVLNAFLKQEDSLKCKAACFLLKHIGIHHSNDRIWTDGVDNPIHFDELDYPDFETSISYFDSLKKVSPVINAKAIRYRDVDTLSATYLIDVINEAFAVWKYPWNKSISFDMFCEYILPYRVSTEPVQIWRQEYLRNTEWAMYGLKNKGLNYEIGNVVNDSIGKSFVSTFNRGRRQEPLPLLGPLNLKHRMQGDCADMVNYTTYCFRSLGIPCTVDFVPYWGTSSGRHYWNVTLDQNGKANYFMAGKQNPGEYSIYKELPKVYRFMYSEQFDCIGSKLKDTPLPDELLKSANLLDVTSKYVKVIDLNINVAKELAGKPIFLCVLNNLDWRPVCGELVGNDGNIVFEDIGCGIIYLPMLLNEDTFTPIDVPHKIYHNGTIAPIKNNDKKKMKIVMSQEDNYLLYRPGKSYKLYYWNKRWQLIQEKIYAQNEVLEFEDIPSNSLYLMVPEYTWGKERPFTYNNGIRTWW